jgi:hypothetical protein
VDVSGSSSISTVVSGVPVGSGYVAELTAQDTAGKLTPCTGSATFNVTSAATASVPVHMSCSVVQQQTGMGGGEAGSGGAGGASGAGGAGGSPAVPVPRGASYALAALLAGLGAAGLRLRRRS